MMLQKHATMKILEVFAYYDEPVLFSCQDDNGQLYLATLENEDGANQVWFYVAVSSERLEAIKQDKITLYDAFVKAESGFVFEVVTSSGQIISSAGLNAAGITSDRLPVPGVYLYGEE